MRGLRSLGFFLVGHAMRVLKREIHRWAMVVEFTLVNPCDDEGPSHDDLCLLRGFWFLCDKKKEWRNA